jgi:hypothetical protein
MQASVNLIQLGLLLDLNTEVVEPDNPAARRNSEIDTRIIEHPFCIVCFDNDEATAVNAIGRVSGWEIGERVPAHRGGKTSGDRNEQSDTNRQRLFVASVQ